MAGTGKAHLRSGDDVLLRAEDLTVEFTEAGASRAVSTALRPHGAPGSHGSDGSHGTHEVAS